MKGKEMLHHVGHIPKVIPFQGDSSALRIPTAHDFRVICALK